MRAYSTSPTWDSAIRESVRPMSVCRSCQERRDTLTTTFWNLLRRSARKQSVTVSMPPSCHIPLTRGAGQNVNANIASTRAIPNRVGRTQAAVASGPDA